MWKFTIEVKEMDGSLIEVSPPSIIGTYNIGRRKYYWKFRADIPLITGNECELTMDGDILCTNPRHMPHLPCIYKPYWKYFHFSLLQSQVLCGKCWIQIKHTFMQWLYLSINFMDADVPLMCWCGIDVINRTQPLHFRPSLQLPDT